MIAARDREWRRRVLAATSIVVADEPTDELGETGYPLYDPMGHDWWLGFHRLWETSLRHAARLRCTVEGIARREERPVFVVVGGSPGSQVASSG